MRHLRWLRRRAHACARGVRRRARLNPHAAAVEDSRPGGPESLVEDSRSAPNAHARGNIATRVALGSARVAATATATRATISRRENEADDEEGQQESKDDFGQCLRDSFGYWPRR